MAQMVKYMVCTIHRWLRWSNIWFASYTDGSDGQIYGLHHTQMAQMVKYMRTIIESLFEKKIIFFVTPSPKDQRHAYGQYDVSDTQWSIACRRLAKGLASSCRQLAQRNDL